ncbi:MAG: hypothetical protein L0241_32695 [Planctomycetia bacterium]|nr:hypothetical protein [Planctomycetia bacterium]
MLNKVLVMTIVSSILAVVRVFLPDLPVPEGLEAAIGVIVMFIAGFFTRETPATVAKLSLK